MKKVLMAILLSGAVVAHAETNGEGSSHMKIHEDKAWGVMVGFGSPRPSVMGLILAHHLNENTRLSAGYGEIEVTTGLTFDGASFSTQTVKATTYDVGGEYLFMEGRFRPLIGAHAAYFKVEGDGEIDIQGFTKSGANFYSNLGIDWLGDSGYQIGTGFNVSLAGASGSSFYLNTGYYF